MKHEMVVMYDAVGAVICNLFEHGVEAVDAVAITDKAKGAYRISWEDDENDIQRVRDTASQDQVRQA